MPEPPTTTIRMFGSLHTIRRERGLNSTVDFPIPPQGCTARSIARDLELPFEKIEGVFVNHVVYDLDHVVFPGDKIAFISTGVPGPHRFMLGIHRAGRTSPKEGE